MSLRWKLNASVIAMVVLFLAAAAVSLRAVLRHGRNSRMYSHMRAQVQFVADVRALIFQQLAAQGGLVDPPEEIQADTWPGFLIDDLDVQIRLAASAPEADLWTQLRACVVDLAAAESRNLERDALTALVHRTEVALRRLRSHFEKTQNALSVRAAESSLVEYVALWSACILVTIILLVHFIMVRDWMVRPIEVLQASVRAIGSGQLEHRVPLHGSDELADLAQGINAMSTELAQRQAALIEARELSAIGELCGNIAHGLRNPLATIRATAQLAQRRCAQGSPAQTLMHELTEQADRMNQRITRLFEFSRAVGLDRVPTTFAELARQVKSQVGAHLESRQLLLETEDRTGDAHWLLDQAQFAESLAELISNAAHHSPPGATIHLEAERLPADNGTGPRLCIRVIDHGAGMDPETQRKAFDPFFTSRPAGIGMGLSLVRRVIERHGGTIAMHSQLGAGTTLTLTLACCCRPDVT